MLESVVTGIKHIMLKKKEKDSKAKLLLNHSSHYVLVLFVRFHSEVIIFWLIFEPSSSSSLLVSLAYEL